jgi:uncharacterized protein (DUF58 family)
MQTPFVREHQEDREITAWFLLDLSGSMDFGSTGVSKRDVMLRFVGVMAKLLMKRGNRIGALLLNPAEPDGFRYIPARMHRQHLLHLLHVIESSPTTQHTHQTPLNDWLKKANGLFKRRSSVFVVSDFISEPGWEKPLAMLARRHDVVALRLQDPLELELPNVGMLWLQDAETGDQLLVDANDAGFRKRFADLAQKREAALRMGLAQAGVDGLVLRTDEALDLSLLRFAQLRKRVSQMGAGVNASVSSGAMAPACAVDWAARNPGGLHA